MKKLLTLLVSLSLGFACGKKEERSDTQDVIGDYYAIVVAVYRMDTSFTDNFSFSVYKPCFGLGNYRGSSGAGAGFILWTVPLGETCASGTVLPGKWIPLTLGCGPSNCSTAFYKGIAVGGIYDNSLYYLCTNNYSQICDLDFSNSKIDLRVLPKSASRSALVFYYGDLGLSATGVGGKATYEFQMTNERILKKVTVTARSSYNSLYCGMSVTLKHPTGLIAKTSELSKYGDNDYVFSNFTDYEMKGPWAITITLAGSECGSATMSLANFKLTFE